MAVAVDHEHSKYNARFRFHASAEAVFRVLTDPFEQMRFTRSRAEGEVRAGGRWSMFDGRLHGEYIAVEPGRLIEMTWRFRDWRDDSTSRVKLVLSPVGADGCDVVLEHEDIPRSDKFGNIGVDDGVVAGWKERIFGSIKKIVGIGYDEE